MNIRSVKADDFSSIAGLTNHYIANTAIHFGATPVTPAELEADWVAGRDRFPFQVAEVDGEVVAFAKAAAFRTRPAYSRTAEVGVYVRPAHQRGGVGRSIVQSLLAACTARGFHVLIAGIALPNPGSRRLFESLGFVHVGTFPEIGFKFGRWHDVGFWHKAIGPADPPAAHSQA